MDEVGLGDKWERPKEEARSPKQNLMKKGTDASKWEPRWVCLGQCTGRRRASSKSTEKQAWGHKDRGTKAVQRRFNGAVSSQKRMGGFGGGVPHRKAWRNGGCSSA